MRKEIKGFDMKGIGIIEFVTIVVILIDLIVIYNVYNQISRGVLGSDIERIIMNIHNSNIYSNDYTCWNYSVDAVNELRKHGYEAYVVVGINENKTDTHAWVKVCRDYDVTEGILEPEVKYKDFWYIVDIPNGSDNWRDAYPYCIGEYCEVNTDVLN